MVFFVCFQRHFNASVGWFSYWRRCSGKKLYSRPRPVNPEALPAPTPSSLTGVFRLAERLSTPCEGFLTLVQVKLTILLARQEVVPHVAMTTAGTPAQGICVEPAVETSLLLPSDCACVRVHVCVGAQADRSAGRLTGSMMELQTLQEALKVEIQIHQVRFTSGPLGQWVRRRLSLSAADVYRPDPTRSRPPQRFWKRGSTILNFPVQSGGFQAPFLRWFCSFMTLKNIKQTEYSQIFMC